LATIPEPTDPLQADSICCYRAAIRWMYEDHKMASITSLTWDEIWSPSLDFLLKQAKRRGPKKMKQNHDEKIDHEFAPYQLVEEFSSIQSTLWNKATTSIKSRFCWLRHRYCLLHSTHGSLRCESIFKGEL
jgi:hypothetical protein